MRADSFITSPSWPVIVSWLAPAIRDASMKSTSPPTGVHARPIATPGSLRAVLHLLVEMPRRAEAVSTTASGVTTTGVASGLRRCRRAILRQIDADLALEVADAGLARVAADDRRRAPSSVNVTCPASRPWLATCRATR